MRTQAAVAIAIGIAGALGVLACTSSSDGASSTTSSSSSGGTCPDDLPPACPAAPPSYAKDVAPVIEQSCTPCHAPGGKEDSRLLTGYANAFANRGAMLNQVHSCRMPPQDAPPLSAEGRKLLQEWLVCGAPND